MAGSKGRTIGIFHLAPALSLQRREPQVCIDPADRRQQGVADLDKVNKPVCSGSEPISCLYHYASSGESHGQGAEEQEAGDEVSMDDMVRDMIKPEKYPAHGS